MSQISKYDELHDRYSKIRTTKSGTRYERLAAFVFKVLDESGIVIHDLKLVGETGAKHQIDVTVEKEGVKKRILIECKDFDISGENVGLPIIRNFWGVVDDIKPDEAIIITCNDFTKDARIYAKGKEIKLAILRVFQDEDWEGRIKSIVVTMHVQSITHPKVGIALKSQEDIAELQSDLSQAGIKGVEDIRILKGQPVYFNTPEGRFPIVDFIEKKSNEYPRNKAGPIELKIPMDGCTIEVEERGGIPILEITLWFKVIHSEQSFEAVSKNIAELIIQGLGDEDLVIFDEDLRRFYIDKNTGEVVEKKSNK